MFEKTKVAIRAARQAVQAIQAQRQPGGVVYTGAAPTDAGVLVSEDSAMRFATVHACVRVLAEDVAALPIHVFRKNAKGEREREDGHPLYALLHDRPNPEMSSVQFKEALMVNALLTGNGYAFIEFDGAGRVKAMWPLLSGEVTPWRDARGELRYRCGGENLAAGEVFHLPGLGFDGLVGLSPIAYARESIGLGRAAESYGEQFFKNGTHLGGVISIPAELTDEQFERLRTQFRDAFRGLQNAHGVPIMEQGATFTPVGIPPEDAQFLETRKFQRSEIAAIYRVPPHMIGDLEHATFTNIEQQDQAYLQRALLPWLMRFELEARWKLVAPAERGKILIEHDTGNFMRGDTATRMQAYSTAIMSGIMTINEARRKENLNPVEGGDEILVPMNMQKGAGGQQGVQQDAEAEKTARRAVQLLLENRDFTLDGTRRAVGGKNIAAQLMWLGVSREAYEQLEKGFHEWLSRQADDIEELMRAAGFTDESKARSADVTEARKDGATQGNRNRLLRSLNDYYEQLAKEGAGDLEGAIQAGEFPGWRDVNDALEKVASSAWKHVADDLGAEAVPDEVWIRGYMKRYRKDMSERLCVANQGDLERVIRRAEGKSDAELFEALSGNLAKWRLAEGDGRWRCGNMARTEAAMMRNEAMNAAYRRAGYYTNWKSAPGCCRICTELNGQRVTTLKPPLHKGCLCTVTRGEKRPEKGLQPYEDGDKLYTEDAVKAWIRSEACNKRISQQKQARHREGTKEYEAEVKQYAAKQEQGPSYIDKRHGQYWTDERLYRLVMEKAGTGTFGFDAKGWDKTETIVLGEYDYIGYVKNNLNKTKGRGTLTNVIKIHYSSTGVHIVPDYPSKKKGGKQ